MVFVVILNQFNEIFSHRNHLARHKFQSFGLTDNVIFYGNFIAF